MYSRKWLIVAVVACGLASACSQYNTNLSVQTSSSTLIFLSPSDWTAGVPGLTITANGAGFASNAIIEWNGADLVTTYVSGTQLTAPVPVSDLTTPGTVQITIKIPGSASSGTSNPNNTNNTTTTEISNLVYFTIKPVPGTPPAITSLSAPPNSQASTPYCSAQGFILTVNGTNFTSDAVVNWNGSARTTTYMSATQLTASISATDAAFPGPAVVTVTNSVGTSKASSFTLSNPSTALPIPTISSLSQTSAPAGSPTLTLTVQGSVLPCTTVQWVNSSNVTSSLATTYVVPAGGGTPYLSAVVPAANLLGAATSQTAQVAVFNLGPGGGTSASSLPFTIAPPAITSLSPPMTPSCASSGFTLTVNGTNFVGASVVNWNGSARTTIVSPTQLTASISAPDIASTGSASITVSNYAVSSNAVSLTISGPSGSLPSPAINSLSPASATAGTGPSTFTLSVNGSNFVPCSTVLWNGVKRATAYVSATQLQATISAADIAAVGTVPVTVLSPAPGGGTSQAKNFSIMAPTVTSLAPSTAPSCAPADMTLAVNGTNFVNGLVVNWNGSPRPTSYVSATQLTAAITKADTAFLATGAAAPAITVSSLTVTSNSSKFSLTTPTPEPIIPPAKTPAPPTISSISPTSAAVETAAGPALLLTVTGTNLFPCSTVQWNGAVPSDALPAAVFLGQTGITSLIPATYLVSVGTNQVTVSSPTALGGTSAPAATFSVFSPGSIPGNSAGIGGPLSLPLMSADQRYGVYVLASTDGGTEVPGTTQNIFVADTCQGAPAGCTPTNTLVSVGLSNNLADGDSSSPSISADGRYVAFLSSATNLVSSDTNGVADVFVRDTCAGAPSGCVPSTQRVSVATNGTQANGPSSSAAISATGRFITFASAATNLGASTSSGGIFLRDTCAGATGCATSTQPLN
jgi:trimeric autotransporter adhesin